MPCFCSVVRTGRSGRGWADTAHATELQSGFCSVVRIGRSGRGSSAAPSFLRLLRFFAAKPGPARFRSGEGVFIHRCHRCSQMREKTGRGQEIVSWPGPHLWTSCSPSVDDLPVLSNPPRRVKVPRPVMEQCRESSEAPSFLRFLRLFAAKPGPARFRSGEGVLSTDVADVHR